MVSVKAGAASGAATVGPAVIGPAARRTAGAAAAVAFGRKMSRTTGGGAPVPRTRRSLRTRGFGASALWAAARARVPERTSNVTIVLLDAIVSCQCHLGAQEAAARARPRELDVLDDQEPREGLNDGQEPHQAHICSGVGEGHERLAGLFLLQVGIAVGEIGDGRPGLGKDLLEVLAQGLVALLGLVEIARPEIGQVLARVLPELPLNPGRVTGLDHVLRGLPVPHRDPFV